MIELFRKLVIGVAATAFSVALGTVASAETKKPGPAIEVSAYQMDELAYKQAAQVYGFMYAQRMTLAAMQKQYPEYAPALKLQELQFDAAYGWPEANAEAIVKTLGESAAQTMIDQYFKPYEENWNRKFSDAEVKAFSSELEERISGKFSTPDIRQNMLWLQYGGRPSSEMVDGKTVQFNSATIPKANGIEVTFRTPASWHKAEGDRPHVVQKWISQNGSGDMAIILIVMTGEDFKGITRDDVEQSYAQDQGKMFVPANASLLASSVVSIDSAPTVLFDTTMALTIAGKELSLRTRTYDIFAADSLISLQCSVTRPSAQKEVAEKRFPRVGELCEKVASTFTIPSQWK